MQDIRHTIAEYEKSREKLQGRILELNAQIAKSAPCKEDSSLKSLLERRGMLYTQVWDLEYAIRQMKEYINADNVRGVKQLVG